MRKCPRCSSEISKYMKACPRCGLPVSQMEEFEKRFNLSATPEEQPQTEPQPQKPTKADKKQQKLEKKLAKKAERKAKRERESKSDTDFVKIANESDEDVYNENDTFSERRKKRKNRQNRPVFDVDENGEFNIDTKDVEIVGEETGKLIDQRFEQSYSVKKSRGDYRPPKVKWWEIYKISDRYFARRKIKKEVTKAARIKPSFISKTKLLLLAIFLGWTGAHNFYAKNKRKGWVSLVSLVIWVGVAALAARFAFFQKIEISVAGLAGLVDLIIWLSDVINIIFNKFKYRLQIDKFISEMNVETRAKLGEKYIDLDLYHKPWWVRFKVWCQKKKRSYEENKRDRRQAKIDKQKRKEAEQREKAAIEKEVYEFEQKQEAEGSAVPEFVDQKTLEELKSFGESTADDVEAPKKKTEKPSKKAEKQQPEQNETKAETAGAKETPAETVKQEEKPQSDGKSDSKQQPEKASQPAKKQTSVPARKYAKTVKNKKAAASKKKKK